MDVVGVEVVTEVGPASVVEGCGDDARVVVDEGDDEVVDAGRATLVDDEPVVLLGEGEVEDVDDDVAVLVVVDVDVDVDVVAPVQGPR